MISLGFACAGDIHASYASGLGFLETHTAHRAHLIHLKPSSQRIETPFHPFIDSTATESRPASTSATSSHLLTPNLPSPAPESPLHPLHPQQHPRDPSKWPPSPRCYHNTTSSKPSQHTSGLLTSKPSPPRAAKCTPTSAAARKCTRTCANRRSRAMASAAERGRRSGSRIRRGCLKRGVASWSSGCGFRFNQTGRGLRRIGRRKR